MNAINPIDLSKPSVKFRDNKRKLLLLGLVVPNIANAAFLGYQFGPKITRKLFASAGPLALHLIIPAIDKHLGEDPDNPPEDAIAALEHETKKTAEREEGTREARISQSSGSRRDQELLLAVSASAAAAGLVGWLARSWFG